MEKKLSHSIRKFIRQEKNRIRVANFDVKKQEELIDQLYKKFLNNPAAGSAKEQTTAKAEPKKEAKKAKASKPKSKNPKKHEK